MKKKILNLVLILMLVGAMFVLTGCGDESNESTTKSEFSNDAEEAETEEDYEEEIDETNGIAIDEVVTEFTGGIALVEDSDENRYVINEKGKVVYTVSTDEEVVVSNGYITVEGHYIYDNKGNEVINDTSRTYGEVSASGYVTVVYYEKDISGSKYYSHIEDLNGNVVSESYSAQDWKYLFEDFFYIYDSDSSESTSSGTKYYLLFNAKDKSSKDLATLLDVEGTGIELTVEDKMGDWYYVYCGVGKGYYWINSDFSKAVSYEIEDYHAEQLVSDEYLLAEGSTGGTSGQYKLFDLNGNELKDFTDIGKVYDIVGYDDVIYVISSTGYIYTLDTTNFEYIAEPVETSTTDSYGKCLAVCDKGVVTTYKGSLCIIDENLDIVEELENGQFLGSFDLYGENFIYRTSSATYDKYVYNTETGKFLQIIL